jgi:adenine C2-methylase RlmN of 23S rRNA A2503 and tRNA A37
MGQPAFRAKQLFKWLHEKQARSFSEMTDQPKAFLAALEERFFIETLETERRQQSKDGTVKYLFRLPDGNCIETVLMRYSYGNTVCVSTQVGCRMGCRFCASTQGGRVRNLTAGEIANEVYAAARDTGERVSISCSWALAIRSINLIMSWTSCPSSLRRWREHRHAQHQPFNLRPRADDLQAGRTASWPDAFGLAACAHG